MSETTKKARVRKFHFPMGTGRTAGTKAIREALSDEGLILEPVTGKASEIYIIRQDGFDVFHVPPVRIYDPETGTRA